jgi:cation diffusion facilitator CzcD-associated flavoprotein CzcO
MRIAVVGAGVAGLATAKVLIQAEHDVTVFDRTPDVGGVWSETRRYPGLTTQSPKAQYSLWDFPMPRDYPEWPTGAQIQRYLEAYAAEFGLDRRLRLRADVIAARPANGSRALQVRDDAGPDSTELFDRLVVANGVLRAGGADLSRTGGVRRGRRTAVRGHRFP